ncbi:MFS transporter [Bacillus sp. B15-48]|uniref:MFS transporter n=1 Tax=Bacillus sp. B15-48 TaxID=1548601 RepID=UPI00193F37F7|nr:MFS transporter [Bacillus sp. B15-48]MBM4761972.1 MFS transporter [Bacillus sp. B15-48]
MNYVEKLFANSEGKSSKKNSGIKSQRWAILSISSIPLVMTLGNSMLIPVLPILEREMGISSLQSSLVITVYSLVAIFLIPIAGYLSDRLGRKKVIIPSLFITAIGGFIAGWATWKMDNGYWLLLVGRALQGAGAAGAFPIVLPLVGDMFKSDDDVSSALGIIETSNTLGKVLSPIFGAFLAGIIWFLPFLSIPILCAISILLMIFFVKNPKKKDPQPFTEFVKTVKEIFAKNGRWLYAIFFIGIIVMFVLFGVLFYLSEILESQYNIKNLKKGLFLALPLGALCLSSYITGKLIKENQVMMKWIAFGGLALLGGTIGILGFSKELWYLITVFLIGAIGIGASLPPLDTLITANIDKKQRGTITSFYSSMRFIGVAAGPPVIALMMKNFENMVFYLLTGLSLAGALVILMAIKPTKKGA